MKVRIRQIDYNKYHVEIYRKCRNPIPFLGLWKKWEPLSKNDWAYPEVFHSLEEAKKACDTVRKTPEPFIPKIIDY